MESDAEDSQAGLLRNLWTYCAARGVIIHPSLETRSAPGMGAGVYSTQKIPKGHRIMHVPIRALYTTSTIPEDFIGTNARKKVPVHAMLAAYLTFGPTEEVSQYGPWMATWPKLSDYTASMPMFWPDDWSERRPPRVVEELEPHTPISQPIVLPPATAGTWLEESLDRVSARGGPTSLARQQQAKLRSHLRSISKLFPQHAASLLDPHNPTYWRFVHNWCSVNTRCFYYIAPGQRKPTEPNEAMAMCPGMDMFNHTDDTGCTTKYDRTGYSIITDKAYKAGDELLLSYGMHNNDVLWAEYGFLLKENRVDAVRIDKLVLDNMSNKQKDMLAEHGYLGNFWLQKDSVSWQVEIAAKLSVLSEKEWVKMVQEGADPTEFGHSSPQVKRKSDGEESFISRRIRRGQVKRKIAEWVLKAKFEAEASIRGLNLMSTKDTVDLFADDSATIVAQGAEIHSIETVRTDQAMHKRSTCLKRWCQIWKMCLGTLRSIEEECEGAFVTGEAGRTAKDLEVTVQELVSLLGK
jgi:SET domain